MQVTLIRSQFRLPIMHRYSHEQVDICDALKRLTSVFDHHQPIGVMHLAAESHVDRSIDGPADFI